jgi:hypothetical protein
MQCKCLTKAGVRCRRRTCKHLECCAAHAQSGTRIIDHRILDSLYVAKSNIKGAGLGLFTRARLPAKTRLGYYDGPVAAAGSHYALNCGGQTLDPTDPDHVRSSALRYANTWRRGTVLRRAVKHRVAHSNNVRMATRPHDGMCAFYTTRAVAAGTELLVSYGAGFRV